MEPTTSSELTILRENLRTVKAEVDALQIAASAKAAPWYRQTSVLLSIVALLFSFGTTAASSYRVYKQDIQAARIELRGLLQKLTDLPKEMIAKQIDYKDDNNARDAFGRLVNQETTILARQSVEIMNRIEGYISATEYFAVSSALMFAGQMKEAEAMAVKGQQVADNPTDEGPLLRQIATLAFARGEVGRGRALMQEALDVFGKYGETNQYLIRMTKFDTELIWAGAEFSAGKCPEALKRLQSAQSELDLLSDGPQKQMFQVQLVAAQGLLGQCR
jgi:hypothetical protein